MFADVLSLLIIPFMLTPFTWYAFTKNIDALAWGVIIILVSKLNSLLKWYLFRIDTELLKRPLEARRCGLLNNDILGGYGGLPGFPSGHLATTSAFFFIGYLFTKSWWFLFTGAVAISVMAWSRIQKKCHNMYQVAGGTVSGIVLGSILWYTWLLIKKIYSIK